MALTPQYQRHSYPFAVVVNSDGRRFIDEGADFRNYTYAKYGQAVLQQPGQVAWQIYDAKTNHLLRDEYRTRHVTKVSADTLEQLADKIEEVNKEQFLQTIREFNAAVQDDVPFNPNVKDGRGAPGLAGAAIELGLQDRYRTLRGLCRDLRRHVHLRRRQDHQRRRSAEYRAVSAFRACLRPARWSAASSISTIPAPAD